MLTRLRASEGSLDTNSECSSSQDDNALVECESITTAAGSKAKRKAKAIEARPDQWVCIVPDEALRAKNDEPASIFISLPDPSTGSTRKYLVFKGGSRIAEVNKLSDDPRSWFIGSSVQTDGSLYLCTTVDPLFLALPSLLTAVKIGKFTTLDAIFEDTLLKVLEKCVQTDQWEHVCDVKTIADDIKVYRYSTGRTLKWLQHKIGILSRVLKEKAIYVGSGSQSSSFIKSKKQIESAANDYAVYACGLVCDYLPTELASQLRQSIGHSEESDIMAGPKHSMDHKDQPPPAKRKGLESEPLEDYSRMFTPLSEANTKVKLTGAQKALAKTDKTGMKSLSSFFNVKPKGSI
ncbi:hypothetical protein EMCRGX_G025910 [Ephydatia muelleri]